MLLKPTFPPPRISKKVDPIDWALRLKVNDVSWSGFSQVLLLRETLDCQQQSRSSGGGAEAPAESSEPGAFQLFGGNITMSQSSMSDDQRMGGSWSTQIASSSSATQFASRGRPYQISPAPQSSSSSAAPPAPLPPYSVFVPEQRSLQSIMDRPQPPPQKKVRNVRMQGEASASASASASTSVGDKTKQTATRELSAFFQRQLPDGVAVAQPRELPNAPQRPHGKADKPAAAGSKRSAPTQFGDGVMAEHTLNPAGNLQHTLNPAGNLQHMLNPAGNLLSLTGRQGPRMAIAQEVLVKADFEGLQVCCRNAGSRPSSLGILVQSILALGQKSNASVAEKSVGMALVWRDLTSNHVTTSEKHCTPTIDCPKWYCACDRHLRCEQARKPLLGVVFCLPDSDTEQHSRFVYFLPLAPCQTDDAVKKASQSAGGKNVPNGTFAGTVELPLRADTTTEERWSALWAILTAAGVYKVLFNAQLALLPLVHTFRRLGQNPCQIRGLLDLRHATYVLNSDAQDTQLELAAILGSALGGANGSGSGSGGGGGGGSLLVSPGLGAEAAGTGKVTKAFTLLHQQLTRVVRLMTTHCAPRIDSIEAGISWGGFEHVEMRLSVLLAALEEMGIAAEETTLRELEAAVNGHIQRITKDAAYIMQKGGAAPFNLASPEQVSHALFDVLGLPPPSSTSNKGKHLSTSEKDLERIVAAHPIVQMVLDCRSLNKTKGTFLEGLKNYYRAEDDDGGGGDASRHAGGWRVHAQWNLNTTRTGRLSCSKPNLQQYPKECNSSVKSVGATINIRAIFRPSRGKLIVSADYSQIEMRILAHFCRDRMLLSILAKNGGGAESDVYLLMAALLFDAPGPDHRKKAKVLN